MGLELFSGQSVDDPLVLDPRIRDWVLLPISVVMVLVTLVRTLATRLLQSAVRPALTALQEKGIVQRSQLLRASGHVLPAGAFAARRAFLRDHVLRVEKSEDADLASQMAADPMAMMEPLKAQLVNMLPNILIMAWVNFFFSGFVVIKLPFMLTPRFRSMLQRGIEAAGLDFNYVSSISWYFLNFMGLNTLIDLINAFRRGTRAESVNTLAMMAPTMAAAPAAAPAVGPLAPDMVKVFRSELDNLSIARHDTWTLADVERRLIH